MSQRSQRQQHFLNIIVRANIWDFFLTLLGMPGCYLAAHRGTTRFGGKAKEKGCQRKDLGEWENIFKAATFFISKTPSLRLLLFLIIVIFGYIEAKRFLPKLPKLICLHAKWKSTLHHLHLRFPERLNHLIKLLK